ncbi:MAG: glycosyltransferase [Ignavibacteriae bacterium]|nr:glycosyltransferase [Ignavibacteriota bacterium]
MSLTDKVIKNTFYNFVSQLAAYLFPFFLIPLIVGKIGQVEFGIYAIAYGFIGAFTLFDLGVSTSFVKFVSEYYYKKDFEGLNSTINIGVAFYFVFTVLFWGLGYLFSDFIIKYINIPPEAYEKGRFALHISLFIFFIATNSNMFVSILISLQKMYINSLLNIFTGVFNFISIIVVLMMGYGIYGLLYCQLATVFLGTAINIILAKKYLPEMSLGFRYLKFSFLKKMTNFGLQMQVSKLAGFFSEKYDEFLLSIFSLLNSVTFFNLSTRIIRFAKIVPMQFIVQVAPVAAELQSREEKEKLNDLFEDTLKYLSFVSIPVSVFIFIFSNEIIFTWMGGGYEVSAYILRVLIVGMLINLVISSPGNSIMPNIGIPKYQMYEGLIHFVFNVIVSYLLIKSYGIVGAAYGNTLATVISSVFVFIVSVRFFKGKFFRILFREYLVPVFVSFVLGILLYLGLKYIEGSGFLINSRINGIISLAVSSIIFFLFYLLIMLDTNYLMHRNKIVLAKIFLKFLPKRRPYSTKKAIKEYNNELVSIVILTYNKMEALKLCLKSLFPTIKDINREVIIWNNNSDDGTEDYLKSVASEYDFVKVINSESNLGNNAKSRAVEQAKGDFIIGVDDDIISFPENWVNDMVRAYKSVPCMGYLVADVVQDDKTNGAKFPEERYTSREYFDGKIIVQSGPAGGWCFMISREVYNETGKLLFLKDRKFVFEDGDYQLRISNAGLLSGILKNTKVYHATGDYYNSLFGNPLNVKYSEAKKPLPLWYKVSRKLKAIFNISKKIKSLKRFLITEELI